MNIQNKKPEVTIILTYRQFNNCTDTTQKLLIEKFSQHQANIYVRSDINNAFYRITFPCSFTEFENKLNNLIHILTEHHLYFAKLHLEMWSSIEIFTYYCLSSEVFIKNHQLNLLTNIYKGSISLNSTQITEENNQEINNELNDEDLGEYYQLFFYVKENNFENHNVIFSIIENWNSAHFLKYCDYQCWGIKKKHNVENTPYLVLTIRNLAGTLFQWNEIENDFFSFLSSNQEYLDKNVLSTAFGIYHLIDDGGEIGNNTLMRLSDFNMGLGITKSIIPPKNMYYPIMSI